LIILKINKIPSRSPTVVNFRSADQGPKDSFS
jgi:hypothetical protein